MKITVMFYIGITTFLLVMLTVMVSMHIAFTWVFYTMCLGQAMLVVMVYKVLSDRYTTDKTFEHFYEDHPIDHNK